MMNLIKLYRMADPAASGAAQATQMASQVAPMFGPWGAVAGAGLGLASSVIGYFDAKKKQKELEARQAQNIRPTSNQAGMFNDYLQYYTTAAQYGLSPQSLAYNTDMNNRGLTAGLRSMLAAGADPNLVTQLYGQYTTGVSATAAQDANAMLQKQQMLGGAMREQIDAKIQDFNFNKIGKWADEAQYVAGGLNQAQIAEQQYRDEAFGNAAKIANTNYQVPSTGGRTPPGSGGTGTGTNLNITAQGYQNNTWRPTWNPQQNITANPWLLPPPLPPNYVQPQQPLPRPLQTP